MALAKGQPISEVGREPGITEETYYSGRKEYGGLRTVQAKRFKEPEKENAWLKKLVADLSLDNAILMEAACQQTYDLPGTPCGSKYVARTRRCVDVGIS